jgi:hypothetical protein
MADSPKNPNVERHAGMPFEKDAVSPLPQFAPRARTAGDAPGSADAPLPTAAGGPKQNALEEYPGPQTASSGEHVEPGREPVNGAEGGSTTPATPAKEA